MRTRTTVVLLLLVVAVGAYIRFYESKRPNTEEASRRAQNVINFDRDKIGGIGIQNGDERIELKRVDKKWRLESPVKDLADGSVVESLLFDLEDWKKEATITGKEIEADKNKMADYGLAKAKLRLKLLGQQAPPEILFGNNAALENRIYVRFENSKNVFLATENIKNAISKKPEEFRDRKLSDIIATQITRVALKTPAGEMELQKQQEKIDAANAKKTDIGWGHQIRSYVLQPYQLVKDLRTGMTSSNPASVLDGNLDDFIQASLAHRIKGGEETVEDLE